MNRLRHNPRIVALVIYALLVNLVWFAAASARHVVLADALCSQTTSSSPASDQAPPSDRHDGCHQFCGGHGVPPLPTAATALAFPVGALSHVLGAAIEGPEADTAPWQARGPPLA